MCNNFPQSCVQIFTNSVEYCEAKIRVQRNNLHRDSSLRSDVHYKSELRTSSQDRSLFQVTFSGVTFQGCVESRLIRKSTEV